MVGARITSTMQDDFPLTITSILMHGIPGLRPQRMCHVAGRRGPAHQLPADRGERARPGQHADQAGRRRRGPGRHILLEHPGAPRGALRGPLHGRGRAHAEHPAVRPAPGAHRQRRPGQDHHRGRQPAACARSRHPDSFPGRGLHRGRRRRHVRARRPARLLLRRAARRRTTLVRVARAGRTFGRGDVLHERDHRRPQGRGVLAPLDVPARPGHAAERVHGSERGGPAAHDRADVPRQRLGHPVRGVHVRDHHAHARQVHGPERAGRLHRGRALDPGLSRPHHLGRDPPGGRASRDQPVVAADGHLRRRGYAAPPPAARPCRGR